MPLTPYHLGPSSAIGIIGKRFIDIPTLLVASVIIDFEPFMVLLFDLDYPLHGLSHSFLIGSAAAVLTAIVMYLLKGEIRPVMDFFKLEQDSSFLMILLSSFIGVYSHIVLDSFFYTDIRPFYPSDWNPFYRALSFAWVHRFCVISFGVAILAWFCRILFQTDLLALLKIQERLRKWLKI